MDDFISHFFIYQNGLILTFQNIYQNIQNNYSRQLLKSAKNLEL